VSLVAEKVDRIVGQHLEELFADCECEDPNCECRAPEALPIDGSEH